MLLLHHPHRSVLILLPPAWSGRAENDAEITNAVSPYPARTITPHADQSTSPLSYLVRGSTMDRRRNQSGQPWDALDRSSQYF